MKKLALFMAIVCLTAATGCGGKNAPSQATAEATSVEAKKTKEAEEKEEIKEAEEDTSIKEEAESEPEETSVPEVKKWEIDVIMNADENDHENNYSVVDYGTGTIFAHCIVKNMPKDTNYLDTYGVWSVPDKSDNVTYYLGGYEVDIGGDLQYAWQYLYTNGDIMPLIRGTYTVTIYNSETDERLGGGSIRVE